MEGVQTVNVMRKLKILTLQKISKHVLDAVLIQFQNLQTFVLHAEKMNLQKLKKKQTIGKNQKLK